MRLPSMLRTALAAGLLMAFLRPYSAILFSIFDKDFFDVCSKC